MRKLLQFLACGPMLWAGVASSVAAQAPADRPTPGVRDGMTGAVTVQETRAIALRGTAEDASKAALPGVFVAASRDGQELETTVTNATGEFVFASLPEGTVDLLFHLDGFEDAKARVTVPPAAATKPGDGVRLVQTLKLRGWSEVVTVRADPPPTPRPARRIVLDEVPSHDRESVCGPAMAEGVVQSPGTIRAGRTEAMRGLFGPGDELLIDGGAATGLRVGQNFIVRRRFDTALKDSRGVRVQGEHSSGLLQIVSVDSQSAVAAVVYACDEMMTGDHLVPFEPEPTRDAAPAEGPTVDQPSKVLFADAGQLLGIVRRKVVIDTGARQGVRTGQRLTLLRRSRFRDNKPTVVGAAVVVAVRRNSATIRIEWATDVIYIGDDGDWAAVSPPSHSARNRRNPATP